MRCTMVLLFFPSIFRPVSFVPSPSPSSRTSPTWATSPIRAMAVHSTLALVLDCPTSGPPTGVLVVLYYSMYSMYFVQDVDMWIWWNAKLLPCSFVFQILYSTVRSVQYSTFALQNNVLRDVSYRKYIVQNTLPRTALLSPRCPLPPCRSQLSLLDLPLSPLLFFLPYPNGHAPLRTSTRYRTYPLSH